MSKPLFSVKSVSTKSQLPNKLTVGRVYFVADEQILIVDHGDGRGPVEYGGKPGPQGIAGEPIPSLQGQIDELSEASIKTTLNLHEIYTHSKKNFSHLQTLIQDTIAQMKSQDEDNANALMSLLLIVNKKFSDYDNAISILANTLAKFYPDNWSGTSGDETNDTPSGIITTDDGTSYKIEQAYVDGDAGVVVLTLYDNTKISQLKAGDTVNMDSGYFVVNNISNDSEQGTISVTLYG